MSENGYDEYLQLILNRWGGENVGRARKQKHGLPLSDGKGRTGQSADLDMIPRQAKTAIVRHEREAKKERK